MRASAPVRLFAIGGVAMTLAVDYGCKTRESASGVMDADGLADIIGADACEEARAETDKGAGETDTSPELLKRKAAVESFALLESGTELKTPARLVALAIDEGKTVANVVTQLGLDPANLDYDTAEQKLATVEASGGAAAANGSPLDFSPNARSARVAKALADAYAQDADGSFARAQSRSLADFGADMLDRLRSGVTTTEAGNVQALKTVAAMEAAAMQANKVAVANSSGLDAANVEAAAASAWAKEGPPDLVATAAQTAVAHSQSAGFPADAASDLARAIVEASVAVDVAGGNGQALRAQAASLVGGDATVVTSLAVDAYYEAVRDVAANPNKAAAGATANAFESLITATEAGVTDAAQRANLEAAKAGLEQMKTDLQSYTPPSGTGTGSAADAASASAILDDIGTVAAAGDKVPAFAERTPASFVPIAAAAASGSDSVDSVLDNAVATPGASDATLAALQSQLDAATKALQAAQANGATGDEIDQLQKEVNDIQKATDAQAEKDAQDHDVDDAAE